MTSGDVPGYVLDVLEEADEPLSTGRIQRRMADAGLDATTAAIRDACESLVEEGELGTVGEPPRQKYAIRNDRSG